MDATTSRSATDEDELGEPLRRAARRIADVARRARRRTRRGRHGPASPTRGERRPRRAGGEAHAPHYAADASRRPDATNAGNEDRIRPGRAARPAAPARAAPRSGGAQARCRAALVARGVGPGAARRRLQPRRRAGVPRWRGAGGDVRGAAAGSRPARRSDGPCRRRRSTTRGFFDGKVVLDIGPGPLGFPDACPARTSIGVEPLAEALRDAGLLLEDSPAIYLPVGAEAIPLVSQSVDVIQARNSLDHVDDPSAVLRGGAAAAAAGRDADPQLRRRPHPDADRAAHAHDGGGAGGARRHDRGARARARARPRRGGPSRRAGGDAPVTQDLASSCRSPGQGDRAPPHRCTAATARLGLLELEGDPGPDRADPRFSYSSFVAGPSRCASTSPCRRASRTAA